VPMALRVLIDLKARQEPRSGVAVFIRRSWP
jgi:hypothetical protein